jgi:Immunity protein 8
MSTLRLPEDWPHGVTPSDGGRQHEPVYKKSLPRPHWDMWEAPRSSPTSRRSDAELHLPSHAHADRAPASLLERQATFADLASWPAPPNRRFFRVIGSVTLSGRDQTTRFTEHWQVPICTASWIQDRIDTHGWTWLHSPLVVSEWNPSKMAASLDAIVGTHADANWPLFVARMSRYMMPQA